MRYYSMIGVFIFSCQLMISPVWSAGHRSQGRGSSPADVRLSQKSPAVFRPGGDHGGRAVDLRPANPVQQECGGFGAAPRPVSG